MKLLCSRGHSRLNNITKAGHCRICNRLCQKKYYLNSLIKQEKYAKIWRLRRYNLTIEDYNKLCLLQNNLCLICKKETKLVVDHNHSTGKVRGLLCSKCNLVLGHYEKFKEYIPAMIEYLQENNYA